MFSQKKAGSIRQEPVVFSPATLIPCDLTTGRIGTGIISVSEQEKSDRIVVGSYGKSGLNRLIPGSVSSFVVKNTKSINHGCKSIVKNCAGNYLVSSQTSGDLPPELNSTVRKNRDRVKKEYQMDL